MPFLPTQEEVFASKREDGVSLIKKVQSNLAAKKSQKAVDNWKASTAQASHDAGAWSGKTDKNWNTPSSTRTIEFNSGKDVNW